MKVIEIGLYSLTSDEEDTSGIETTWGNLQHAGKLPPLTTQSRIIGTVRGAHSQLWGTIIPVCSLYAAREHDRRFGTPAIV